MTDGHPAPPEGFAEFVTARSPALLRSAWLLTGDVGRAEDLLQTVLAAAWQRWSTVSTGHPEAYLRRALFTTYVSWWRRRWRAEVPAAAPPEQSGPSDLARESADRDALRRALARLSRQQRAIVVLRYAEDLSVERTAEVLGCSTNTVKVQSSRALRSLRTDPNLDLFTQRKVVS
ncbi:SigE family RNA polymerase sigma factor [Verrucosispora sp. NA02020]|uniref:SigE family RNA polymerase sigma factor n=1 Tax=unclassified Micromonospora TaxID=2617518 RepID=UPI0015907B6C|nr:SigE family RNA polymerase sigma factor [Verrucosispora sp. NA02020]QKW15807.1 SigE family RNA polymerase sigma factor [Verrucosispora sp. NA02020]